MRHPGMDRSVPVGSRHTKQGYVWVKTVTGWMPIHRLVGAAKMGRFLRTDEVAHHVNGDKMDNRPENICVLPKAIHDRIDAVSVN